MPEETTPKKGSWQRQGIPDLAREPRFGVRVLAAVKFGKSCLRLRLERPPDFVFSPGQYVWLVLPSRTGVYGAVDRHAYSISSSADADHVEIFLRLTESAYLQAVGALSTGDHVEIIGPMGSAFSPSRSGTVMVAGGVGVSPFLSIARSRSPGRLSLYWFGASSCGSDERNELAGLANSRAIEFKEDEVPTVENLKKAFSAKGDTRPIFVSGPQGFVDFVAKAAHDCGVAPERLRYEAVYPLSPSDKEITAVFSGVDSSGRTGNRAADVDRLALMKLLAEDDDCKESVCGSFLMVFFGIVVAAEIILSVGYWFAYRQLPIFLIGSGVIFAALAAAAKMVKDEAVKSHLIVGSFFSLLVMSRLLPDYAFLLEPWSLTMPLVASRFVRPRAALYYSVSYLAVFCAFWVMKSRNILPGEAFDHNQFLQFAVAMVFVTVLTQFFARRDFFYRQKMVKKDESQKKFLSHLERSNRLSQFFAQIFQETGSPVIFTDSSGRVLYANRAAEKITGYSFAEMRYQTPRLWGGLMSADYYGGYWKDVSGGESVVIKLVNRRRDGVLYTVLAHITPLVSMRDGRVFAYVATEEDITELQEIDKAKTEFVSLASHQLQTPLASINWYAELLGGGDAGKTTARQREYLDEIIRSSTRMAELVGALLNVSRIDMGRFAISPEPVDLKEALASAVGEQKFSADKKHQRLAVSMGKLPRSFSADPKLLRIIFQNLLSNAIKYTPEGGEISITSGAMKAGETFGKEVLPENSLCFSIRDSGYGIPKEQQPKIFTKLFRADNAKNMVTDGTGLGLYIVKSIIESAGGRIWFESEENRGTTFYFTLPVLGMREKSGDRTIE